MSSRRDLALVRREFVRSTVHRRGLVIAVDSTDGMRDRTAPGGDGDFIGDWTSPDDEWWDALMRGRAALTFADIVHRPAWQIHAACRDLNPDEFFTESVGRTLEMKAVCSTCPVRDECLSYALERDIRYGVWGGLEPHERDPARTRRAGREMVIRPSVARTNRLRDVNSTHR